MFQDGKENILVFLHLPPLLPLDPRTDGSCRANRGRLVCFHKLSTLPHKCAICLLLYEPRANCSIYFFYGTGLAVNIQQTCVQKNKQESSQLHQPLKCLIHFSVLKSQFIFFLISRLQRIKTLQASYSSCCMNELRKPSATCLEFGICILNLKGRTSEREKNPTFESWSEHIWDQSSTGE